MSEHPTPSPDLATEHQPMTTHTVISTGTFFGCVNYDAVQETEDRRKAENARLTTDLAALGRVVEAAKWLRDTIDRDNDPGDNYCLQAHGLIWHDLSAGPREGE